MNFMTDAAWDEAGGLALFVANEVRERFPKMFADQVSRELNWISRCNGNFILDKPADQYTDKEFEEAKSWYNLCSQSVYDKQGYVIPLEETK